MTTFLASISPAGWVCIALGAYLILACIGSAGWSFAVSRLKRLKRKRPAVEHVDWTLSLPPVPAPLDCRWCAEVDADWLADQPTDVWLTDELASRMCREILAIEGLSS